MYPFIWMIQEAIIIKLCTGSMAYDFLEANKAN